MTNALRVATSQIHKMDHHLNLSLACDVFASYSEFRGAVFTFPQIAHALESAMFDDTANHTYGNIVLHAYTAWLVQQQYKLSGDAIYSGRVVLELLTRTYSSRNSPRLSLRFSLGYANGFFHAAEWQSVISTYTENTFDRRMASKYLSLCDVTRVFLPSCVHGAGHGFMMNAIIRAHDDIYDACRPLAFNSTAINQSDLDASLLMCGFTHLECHTGVYHAYISITVIISNPALPYWLQPCNSVRRFAMACFMFAMNDYDNEGFARSFADPSVCKSQPMDSEHNMLGCISMAAGGVDRNSANATNELIHMCDRAAGNLRQRWLACLYGALAYGMIYDASCAEIEARRLFLLPESRKLCTSNFLDWTTDVYMPRYPAWLLEMNG